MKVRDLIKDTLWFPGRGYAGAPPVVSVLMPTFRRGQDGSFLKAANSVLGQTLRDIELIVVDDGSIDDTAQQIEALMAEDERVSCLRHPENIGLPAVSEFEAFVRARGEFVAFGFDDFVFEPNALSELVAFPLTSSRAVVHGYVGWFDGLGNQHFYGEDAIPHEQMKFFNFLANAGFLVPRAILEDVGLFDPHIAAARLCDWDLWRRILNRYPIYRAPVFVGIEHGTTRQDSLGNTYPLIEESLQGYFSIERGEHLKSGNFPEFDVWKMPKAPSVVLATHIFRAREFFQTRFWAGGLPFGAETDARALLTPEISTIGIFGPLNFSAALIFDGLPPSHRQRLLHIHPDLTDAQLGYYLAGCSAVIMACHLLDVRGERVKSMCITMQIPLYCLIDDNPVATKDRLTSVLRDFVGVLCASAPLAAPFREDWLHSWIREVTPLFDPVKQAKLDRGCANHGEPDVRIGIMGGDARPEALADVASALSRLDGRVAVEILTDCRALPELPFPVRLIDSTHSLDEFLMRWNPFAPDILIHARGSFEPASYEYAQLLLIARYLHAAPLVFEATDKQLMESAILAACDPAWRAEKGRWLGARCARAFAPDQNIRVLAEITARHGPVDTVELVVRLRKMLDYNAARAVRAEGELNECTSRLAKADIELASRSYRAALRLRKIATWMRQISAWLRWR